MSDYGFNHKRFKQNHTNSRYQQHGKGGRPRSHNHTSSKNGHTSTDGGIFKLSMMADPWSASLIPHMINDGVLAAVEQQVDYSYGVGTQAETGTEVRAVHQVCEGVECGDSAGGNSGIWVSQEQSASLTIDAIPTSGSASTPTAATGAALDVNEIDI